MAFSPPFLDFLVLIFKGWVTFVWPRASQNIGPEIQNQANIDHFWFAFSNRGRCGLGGGGYKVVSWTKFSTSGVNTFLRPNYCQGKEHLLSQKEVKMWKKDGVYFGGGEVFFWRTSIFAIQSYEIQQNTGALGPSLSIGRRHVGAF